MTPAPTPLIRIPQRFILLRTHRVLLDTDLAELHGVPTKVLLQAVKRNLNRFTTVFMFQLKDNEWEALRSQIVTSKTGWGVRRYAPYAFTEQGEAMLSLVLNSPQAIAVNIEIMRAFVRLHEVIVSKKEIALRLVELESKADLIEVKHDNFKHNARVQFKRIFEAIRALMAVQETPKKRRIGFTAITMTKS